jgi:hypothetical protein
MLFDLIQQDGCKFGIFGSVRVMRGELQWKCRHRHALMDKGGGQPWGFTGRRAGCYEAQRCACMYKQIKRHYPGDRRYTL